MALPLPRICARSSDIRVIITAYQTAKVSDDHPYIWRYTARRALVIFDHPYNESALGEPGGPAAHGARICIYLPLSGMPSRILDREGFSW